jgi:hypothetical protein
MGTDEPSLSFWRSSGLAWAAALNTLGGLTAALSLGPFASLPLCLGSTIPTLRQATRHINPFAPELGRAA